MATRYETIIRENLQDVLSAGADDLEARLPAEREGALFRFRAFGMDCCLGPDAVSLAGRPDWGPRGLLVSLYAKHASRDDIRLEPFRAFKEMPDSMPYQGAFKINSERVLIPYVSRIREVRDGIAMAFHGEDNPTDAAGDFSLLLYPLPKIGLCYVFYLGDEDFPPSATCLFSANALSFMPLDGLADVAEYTSKEIIRLSA